MTELILSNCKLWLAEYDLSGKLNALAINDTPDMLDNTRFGHTAKSRKKGRDGVIANHQGFWDIDVDDVIMTDLGVTNVPMTFAAITGAEGEAAYSFLCQVGEYNLGGSIGELLKFTVQAENTGGKLVRGSILLNGTKIISGDGTAYELGAIGAAQKMYAALHVLAASAGDTLDVVIQSDALEAFGSPAPQITFAQNSGVGYEWLTKDGAVADTWWRVSWTIAGSNPSFEFIVFAGIE